MKVNIAEVSRKGLGHLSTQMDQCMKANGRMVFDAVLENTLMQMVIGMKDRGKIIVRTDMECTITMTLPQSIQVQ
jgi:hypothetical protein